MIDSAWKSWYRSTHNERCQQSGLAFEEYVDAVLRCLHADYLNPEPMGALGDGGCDGIAEQGNILYACYGQRAKTRLDQKTKEKLESDFTKSLTNWPDFKVWRFVTNAPLGPGPTQSLIALQKQHAEGTQRPLKIEVWRARHELWELAVSQLSMEQLNLIMPGVPHAKNVTLSDLVSLIQSLETAEEEQPDYLNPIKPVPPSKMDFNNLKATTKTEFNEGRLLSQRIDKWFSEQADPGLRDRKAKRFRQIYTNALSETRDSREIVRRVYGALGGQDFDMSTNRANAVYAVTAYFFDSCDIFEEPPAEGIRE